MRFALVYFLVGLSVFSCRNNAETELVLSEYSVVDSLGSHLKAATAFRNTGELAQADSAYTLALTDVASANYKEYIQLNQLLCRLISNDTLYVEKEIESKRYKGLASLVNGILLTRKDRSGFDELRTALRWLSNEGLTNSFYYPITIEQLGLAHRQKGSYMDSVKLYYKKAHYLFANNTDFQQQAIRLLHRLATHSLVHRDELTGIGYVDEALLLPLGEEQRALFLLTKATLLRKLKRVEESHEFREQANQLIKLLGAPYLRFHLYREEALYNIAVDDTVSFNMAISRIKALERIVPSAVSHAEFLKGVLYFKADSPQAYIKPYERALKGFRKERIPNSTYVQECLYALTKGYRKVKQFDKSKHYAYLNLLIYTPFANEQVSFRQIIDPVVQNETYIFIDYDLLGSINLDQYYFDHNENHLKDAYVLYSLIDSLMVQQVRTQEDESVFEFLRIAHAIYTNAIETCYLLNQHTRQSEYVDKAHVYIERSKSLVVYRDARKRDKRYFPEVPLAFKTEELRLKSELSAIKREGLTGQKKLAGALKKLDAYYVEMKAKYPAYYRAQYQADIPAAAFFSHEADRENKSIINYHLSSQKLFAIRYDGKPVLTAIDIDNSFIDSLQRLRQQVAAPNLNSLETFRQNAYYLYRNLLEPLGLLRQHVEIVPDGVLGCLPFDALTTDTAGGSFKTLSYLLKKHNVSYRTGLKARDVKPLPIFNKILAYAHTDDNNSALPSLKGAVREQEILKENFSSARFIQRSGRAVRKNKFLQDIDQGYDLIHISLHAVSDVKKHLANSIYFSTGKKNESDTLYGFEIVPHDIGSPLVVLTSCNSGMGALAEGEGIISLSRSFIQAGAAGVVASQWSLPDYSSPLLCGVLYKKMKEGLSPASSLHEAKKQYLISADINTASPFFWAGLVCFDE